MKFRHPLTSILCITTMVLTTGFTGSTTVYAAQTNDGLTPLQNFEESERVAENEVESRQISYTLYVGNQLITDSGYWTTSTDGKLNNGTEASWNVHYDSTTNTLTLNNATIAGANPESTLLSTSGIFASSSSGDVALTISLRGENTITSCQIGIFVYSSTTGNASLTITGSGSLDASGSQHGIHVQSNGGGGALEINNARIKAAGGTYTSHSGVWVQAQNGSDVSLTVNGGNLIASGNTGIALVFGSGVSGSGTPSLTVTGNATVDAKNGGIANNSSSTVQVGPGNGNNGGIVFDGKNGTVYGDVTLQEDLEIGEGESLTIGQDASLTTDGKLTVNGGTLNGTPKGDVTYKVTGVSLNKDSLTLDEDSSETLNATVAPNNATNQEVTWTSNEEKVATVDESGKVVAVAPGTATITVTTKDGSKTDTCTVVVTHGNLVHTPKQEPTCNDVGTQEYWTCDICGKHYSDSSATDEVSLADLTIPQLSCPTQSTSSSTTQPTATYDDGGPFTTDQYGNVYDRWGNEIWHNPSPQSASNTTIGYQLVATIDK